VKPLGHMHGKEICAKDIRSASVINQIFATSPRNVRLTDVEEWHAQDKGHTKSIRADHDHEPICTVVHANISHFITEALASLTFSACLRGWSYSPRNVASFSEMKFSDVPVSANACAQCSLIRVLKNSYSVASGA